MRSHDWNRAKTAALNPTQLAILELLEGRRSGIGVKEIAAQLGVAQPTATDSINALERKELLAKCGANDDRRAVNVVITSQGLATLAASGAARGAAEQAVDALSAYEQEDLLIILIRMIKHLQTIDAIPIQRMCVTCRYFAPFAHTDAAQPHHCNFVNAAFGQRDLRIDCREHETADPSSRTVNWNAFQRGLARPL